jgi:DNA-binding CsgD family transcriptional regulator
LAETAEDYREVSDYDDLLNGLTVEQRDLLFPRAQEKLEASWAHHRNRARLLAGLQPTLPRKVFTPDTRILNFIRHYAASRAITHAQDYLSQFRVLERKFGRPMRLRDLSEDFILRFVADLSAGSRKRVMSIWNAAARAGIIQGPLPKTRYPAMVHPALWPSHKLERFLIGVERLVGQVRDTCIPQSTFWSAIVSVAADSGLPFSTLRRLSWQDVTGRDAMMAKLTVRTLDYLQKLDGHGCNLVFPWSPAGMFYKHYSKVLRVTGVTADSLTARERDILLGTAAGLTEGQLAERYQCCKGVVVEYRKRLREKLGLQANTSLKTLALTAKKRGFLPDDVNADSANDSVYRRLV